MTYSSTLCDFVFDYCLSIGDVFLLYKKDNSLARSCQSCYDRKISKFTSWQKITEEKYKQLEIFK